MTEANLVTIDTNNYESMAKAMGIATESNPNEKKAQQLPRFRINHTPNHGKRMMEVNVVKGGTYKLEIPEGQILYMVRLQPSDLSCRDICTKDL